MKRVECGGTGDQRAKKRVNCSGMLGREPRAGKHGRGWGQSSGFSPRKEKFQMINDSQSPLLQVDELNLQQQLTSDEWSALFTSPQDAQGN